MRTLALLEPVPNEKISSYKKYATEIEKVKMCPVRSGFQLSSEKKNI